MNEIDSWIGEIHRGDVLDILQQMPENSIHMVVCSPPYYGKRDYGEEDQIGLEESPDGFVDNLVNVGKEIYRVLRADGSWYLNLGDTYAGGGGIAGVPDDWDSISTNDREKYPESVPARDVDFPDKCKMLIPHRVAIGLIDDGWICRNDNIWEKLNPMPESVEDRRTNSFEFVFHFVKDQEYWYDQESVRTTSGANQRDIFKTMTASHPDAHFAVYPEELIEPLIKSSCPENGIVLDPFIGSGTTAVVAENLNRRWVGVDMNKEYVDMAYQRIEDETKLIFDERSVFNY